MSEFIETIEQAYQEPDNEVIVLKAHRLFLSHMFIMPVRKNANKSDEPIPLFFTENKQHFLPIFTNDFLFREWAGDNINQMDWLNLLGKDVVLGTGLNTYLCMDIGQNHYKEFDPSEIKRLQQVTLKVEKIARAASK